MHRVSPEDEKVIVRGLAVQPLVAWCAGFLLVGPPFRFSVSMGVLFAWVAIVIANCLAYPLLLWFLRRGTLTRMRTLLSGAVLGNIPALIAGVMTVVGGRSTDLAHDIWALRRPMVAGTVAGFASAAAFWALSGRHLTSSRQ